MTALSPGLHPHEYSARMRLVLETDGHPCARVVVIRRDGQSDQQAEDHADEVGRAMASAHEALAVLEELAMPEDKLIAEYVMATGQPEPDLKAHSPGRMMFQHWVWLRNDVLRNKAAAVLEKAKVTP